MSYQDFYIVTILIEWVAMHMLHDDLCKIGRVFIHEVYKLACHIGEKNPYLKVSGHFYICCIQICI